MAVDNAGWGEQMSEWISVKDRLPKYAENVLFYSSQIEYGWREGKEDWIACGDTWISNVTHWMPLPEPPK